jgi:hypothetical protein
VDKINNIASILVNKWGKKTQEWDSIFVHHRNLYLLLMSALISFVSIILRFLTAGRIELGGDAFYKWGLIRQSILHGDLPINATHHGLRWAINFPVYLIQLFFGDSAINYYIWPFASSAITAIFCFLLVEKLTNWRWGLLTSFAFMTSWHVFRSGTQFLPLGAAAMYMVAALFFLLLYVQQFKWKYILISGVLFFFSYGVKVTAIYYLPAFLIVIFVFAWRHNGDLKDCWKPIGVFCSVLAVLLAAETALIYCYTGYFGRIEAFKALAFSDTNSTIWLKNLEKAKEFFNKHPYAIPPYPEKLNWQTFSVSPWQYAWNILIYISVWKGGVPRFLFYIAAFLSFTALMKRRKDLYFIAIPYLFGFFAHAYAIRSLEPLLRPEKALNRYWALLMLLATLVTILYVAKISKQTKRPLVKCSIGFLAIVLVLWQAIDTLPKKTPSINGLQKVILTEKAITEARKNRQAILVTADTYKTPWGYSCIYAKRKNVIIDINKLNKERLAFDIRTGKVIDYEKINLNDTNRKYYLVLMERNGNTNDQVMKNYIEIKL